MIEEATERRIIEAALRQAGVVGWPRVSFADVAREAGCSLLDVYRICPSRSAILVRLFGLTDQAVLSQGGVDGSGGESPRDRLFDVMMRRFDALRPFRSGLASVYSAIGSRPFEALRLAKPLAQSMSWMLVASGIEQNWPRTTAATAALAAIYVNTFSIWLEDKSPDCARTMAALDRRLRQAESLRLLGQSHHGSTESGQAGGIQPISA